MTDDSINKENDSGETVLDLVYQYNKFWNQVTYKEFQTRKQRKRGTGSICKNRRNIWQAVYVKNKIRIQTPTFFLFSLRVC